MPQLRRYSTAVVWGALCVLLAVTRSASASEEPQLKITLRDHVQTTDSVIRIKHVARLEGPSKAILKRWQELDLLDIADEPAEQIRVSRSLVTARLLLAGCQSERMEFSGPAVTELTRVTPREQNDLAVEQLAQQEIARQLGIEPDLVEVRLLSPCISRLRPAGSGSELGELDVIPPASRTSEPRITVRWLEGGVVKSTLVCSVQIRISQDCPMAARALPAGHLLGVDDMVMQSSWCPWGEMPLSAEQCVGQRLKRPLIAQAKLTVADLAKSTSANTQPQSAPVIKPRDLIRVSAVRGNLSVVLPSAEALQAGRPGDRIRIRNLESQRVITGTVVAAGEVEIPLR